LVIFCLAAFPVSAGTVAAARFAGPGTSPGGTPNIQMEIQDGKLRLDIQQSPMNVTFLYDRSSGVLTVLDHYVRAYEEFGSTKRLFLSKTLGMALKLYEMRLANIPPQMKTDWERTRSAIVTVFAASFKKAASGVKVGGTVGNRYEAKPKGAVLLSMVSADPSKTPLSGDDWKLWKEFCALVADAGEGGLAYFGVDPDKLNAWPGVPGFPLSVTWTEGKKRVYSIQMQSLRSQGLSNDDFKVPPGYESKILLTTL
jgi:hypothetical protein